MGASESIAPPFVRGREAANAFSQEFLSGQRDVYALLQEGHALREEALALRGAPDRQSLLMCQASFCYFEALKLVRAMRKL